jgi:hypothetical protein
MKKSPGVEQFSTIKYPGVMAIDLLQAPEMPENPDDETWLRINYLRISTRKATQALLESERLRSDDNVQEKPTKFSIQKLKRLPPNCFGDAYIISAVLEKEHRRILRCTVHEIARTLIPEERITSVRKPNLILLEGYNYDDTARILERIISIAHPPVGRTSIAQLRTQLSLYIGGLNSLAEAVQKINPEAAGQFINDSGRLEYYLTPEGIDLLKSKFDQLRPPEGWRLIEYFYDGIRRVVSLKDMVAEARKYYADHPESVKIFFDKNAEPREHFSPELMRHLTAHFEVQTGAPIRNPRSGPKSPHTKKLASKPR